MGTIIPPAMFGIDPEETWDFVPSAWRDLPKEEQASFALKAPDAGLDQAMEDEQSALVAAVRKTIPEKDRAEFRKLSAIAEDARTEEENARLAALDEAWSSAFIAAIEKTDRVAMQRRVLALCVAGWTNYRTKSGKLVAWPKDPQKIIDCLGPALRAEIFAAVKRGAEITSEEKASLT